MIMIGFVVLLLICSPFLWWYSVVRKYKCLDGIPGPKLKLFVGSACDIGSTPQEFFNNIWRYSEQYGDMFKLYLGSELIVFTTRAETLEKILSSHIHTTKGFAYDILRPWIHDGLITSAGTKWRTRRKMIIPCFSSKILEHCLEVFNSSGNILTKMLETEVGKGSFDAYPYINLFTLDVICETAMGVKISSQKRKNLDYVQAIRDYLTIGIVRVFRPWQRSDTLFKFFPSYKLHKQSLDILQNFSDDVIAKRRAEKRKVAKHASSDCDTGRKIALIDMLLEFEDVYKLSHEDIKEEINTFLFAGHDTTSSALCFSLLALAENQEIQNRVHAEIVGVVGEKEYVTKEHLHDTKYLDVVLKEVLRMYPSVPFIERRLESDFNINGTDFPEGVTFFIYIYGILHNKKYFPNPSKFDPDRFLPENQSKMQHYAYVPFSAGPRNCIGQQFAWFEMKTTIIKILQKFQILSVPGYKPELGMAGILKSFNGINICLEERYKQI